MEDTRDNELNKLKTELEDLRGKYNKIIQNEHHLQSS